jgi:large subunit ribosomal protein L9
MAEMFEKDVAGFTEEFDPNAEPGEIATDAGESEASAAEEAAPAAEGEAADEA